MDSSPPQHTVFPQMKSSDMLRSEIALLYSTLHEIQTWLDRITGWVTNASKSRKGSSGRLVETVVAVLTLKSTTIEKIALLRLRENEAAFKEIQFVQNALQDNKDTEAAAEAIYNVISKSIETQTGFGNKYSGAGPTNECLPPEQTTGHLAPFANQGSGGETDVSRKFKELKERASKSFKGETGRDINTPDGGPNEKDFGDAYLRQIMKDSVDDSGTSPEDNNNMPSFETAYFNNNQTAYEYDPISNTLMRELKYEEFIPKTVDDGFGNVIGVINEYTDKYIYIW